jgi:hypothetical protein
MLLRSVSQHIKDQNWFAVLIDFLIVVVGVFIGIQVANWNVELGQKHEEQILLMRLLQDTEELLNLQEEGISAYQGRMDRLISIQPIIFSNQPLRPLTDSECTSILSSHVYRRPPDELPVLDEILSSGRFDIIKNESIKSHLRTYIITRERARATYSQANNNLFRLHSNFPNLIAVIRKPYTGKGINTEAQRAGEGFEWQFQCDIKAMRENQGFINELMDNIARVNSLLATYQERKELLEELRTALAAELNGKA